METKNIRLLKSNEVECRVQSVTAKGCILLLYKNARCDMKILDEVFGIYGWQREHEVIDGNLFCTISIWSDKSNSWIKKQDVGTESMADKEKGQASDAFKRAAFNIGIGRELYTSPFIWVNLSENELSDWQGKKQLKKGIKFEVESIGSNNENEINELVIKDNKGVIRYSLSPKAQQNSVPLSAVKNEKEISFKKDLKISLELLKECDTIAKLKQGYKALTIDLQNALKDEVTELKTKLEANEKTV